MDGCNEEPVYHPVIESLDITSSIVDKVSYHRIDSIAICPLSGEEIATPVVYHILYIPTIRVPELGSLKTYIENQIDRFPGEDSVYELTALLSDPLLALSRVFVAREEKHPMNSSRDLCSAEYSISSSSTGGGCRFDSLVNQIILGGF